MECCGQNRMTKFCPDCGEPITAHILGGLLKEVRLTARGHLSKATKYDGNALDGEPAGGQVDWRRAARLANERYAKWQGWADELEKAIAALAEKETS